MVEIKLVKTKNDLRKFVDFPNKLYKNNKFFVPAFYGDDLDDWDKKKNPAFEYCDAECYLAYKDNKLVGRIGVIISHAANKKFNTKRCRFTQVDFIDDYEVSSALFETAEKYAIEHGCDEMHGPLGFCDMDREGMLVEGYDIRSMFITYYNHPYYIEHLEKLGYIKDVDWIEFKIYKPDADSKEAIRFKRISDRIMQRNNYHIAEIKHRKDYKPYIKKVFNLANEAYAPLYAMVPLNERQVDKYATKFIPLINPDYACFLMDENEEMVALGVCAPSMASAMQKCRGRLFPFGWIWVLRSLSKNNALDMFLVAVKPELQGKGLNAVILNHLINNSNRTGIEYAETGPMLETNAKVLAQWETFKKERHKRRRCFIKKLK